MIKNTHKRARLSLLLIISICVVVLISIVFALDRSGVVDILPKGNNNDRTDTKNSTQTSSDSPRSINDIDYSPATEEDNSTIESKKSTGAIDEPQGSNQSTGESIGVILSAAGQDNPGGPIIVRTILNNVSYGVCNLSLTKDSVIKSYTSDVTWTGTYYSCNGFDVPLTDLSAGTWQLRLSVNEGQQSGDVSRVIDVEN